MTCLPNIYFEFNSDKIKPALYPVLDEVVSKMKGTSSLQAIIEGHTDNIGSDEYNLDLSKRRAESVKNYLIEKGVSETKLSSVGYGKSKPIVDNSTKEGQAQNRRVEVLLVGK